MNRYAQTNIQLYGQLLAAAERPEAEVRLVRDAYELALSLFAGHYRGNGKPFLAHLVGVASILLVHGASIETITAGLLHSVYSLGEFGDGTRGISSRKRQKVQKVVGKAVEDIIARYGTADWSLATITSSGEGSAAAIPKEVLQIKMADVLEDHLDQGLEFIPAKRLGGGADNHAWTLALATCGDAIGAHELAGELRACTEASQGPPVPEYLVKTRGSSVVIAPRSHRERVVSRVRRKLSRWIERRKQRAQRRAA